MSSPSTPFSPLEALKAGFRRACVRRLVGDEPGALDVLKNMQGDCNEHTYLFVGLARSVGLPAKVRVGIMYVDEFFGYHAWPAVHVNGRWHDLDPTLGQTVVDSTHVSLLEGELENQMMLMQYLGQLTIEVLPEPETDD